MAEFPKKLTEKLEARKQQDSLRKLHLPGNLIDFSSNDYLGFARSQTIFEKTHQFLIDRKETRNGSAGSRLLTGNYSLLEETENKIAAFHQAESALLFNSGYDANVGFFQSVPQRNDVILYDELCHASIRDGIGLSRAKAYKFGHNDIEELGKLLERFSSDATDVYVVTESIFSMDGDAPDLEGFADACGKYRAFAIVDEAHALGVFGEKGCGRVQELGLSDRFFARIMTFGKGLGCHGSAILGSVELRSYLVNFARSLMYTTALSPHAAATIFCAYDYLETDDSALEKLKENIAHFNQEKNRLGLKPMFVYSKSAIQCAIVPGNSKVKAASEKLKENGFDVRPILSPTVPEGQERLRICLHSYNSKEEISGVLGVLAELVFQ